MFIVTISIIQSAMFALTKVFAMFEKVFSQLCLHNFHKSNFEIVEVSMLSVGKLFGMYTNN